MLNFRSLFINTKEKDAKKRKVYGNHDIEDIWLVYSTETDCYLKVSCKNGKLLHLCLNPEDNDWSMDGIIIPDYIGSWYTIDSVIYNGEIYYLLEHEEYGDETACLIVDNNNNVIADDVYDEWTEALENALE